MSAHCKLETRRAGPAATVVAVEGELDIADADAFESLLADARAAQHDVIVDLTSTTFVDVVPFGLLVRHADTARAAGTRLLVAVDPATDPVGRLAEITRSPVDLVAGVREALVALNEVPEGAVAPGGDPVRERLLDSILEEAAGTGWDATTVGAVVRRARATREDFYRFFEGREDCCRQALRFRMGDEHGRWMTALAKPGAPLDGPREAVEGYLHRLAGRPALARCYLLENPVRRGAWAAHVASRRMDVARALQRRLRTRRATSCHALVAAVPGVAADQVAAGRIAELPSLAGPLVEVLAPLVA